MTDIKKSNDRPIKDLADALSLYEFAPSEISGKIGVEVEMHLYEVVQSEPVVVNPHKMEALQSRLKRDGFDAQLEAASVVEYASPAFALGDMSTLIETIDSGVRHFGSVAGEHGLFRAPYSIMPDRNIDEALQKMIQRERLHTGIASVREVGTHGALAVPLLTAGVQLSFSPKSAKQLFRMAKRAYALMPLIYAAFNSDTGYAEGKAARSDHHVRGNYYEGYGAAGGIAESFLSASNSSDYLHNHVSQVFETPMYFAYQLDGSLLPATAARPITFEKLELLGLNTQANYELAESFLYHDVKICNLRDDKGQTIGKRLEVRAADSGMHQPITVPLLLGALIPDGQAATKFDRLLTQFCVSGHPPADGALLRKARQNAIYHQGRYMDVAYGFDPQSGTDGRLLDLAGSLASIVQEHYKGMDIGHAGQQGLQKLLHILQTGESDAARYAKQFTTKAEANAFLVKQEPLRKMPKPQHLVEGVTYG